MKHHSQRKHSVYSASGADRWFNCPGSVALSEGIPSKDSVWSLEGTRAHEVLEYIMLQKPHESDVPREMMSYCLESAAFLQSLHRDNPGAELLVERRVYLDFIHEDAFGTLDYSVVDHFGTLHIVDFKYGTTPVSAVENLQFLFYAIAAAHEFDWNFKRIRMWVLQPRIKGFDGPRFWEIPTAELLTKWVPKFEEAIARVELTPDVFTEGAHCHWCKAKQICPLKKESKLERVKGLFSPISKESQKDGEKIITEADWRKKAKSRGLKRSQRR